jgi:WD40 repeat protein
MAERLWEVAFSRDGRYLAAAGNSGVILFDTRTWTRVRAFHNVGVEVVSLAGAEAWATVGPNGVYVISSLSGAKLLPLPGLRGDDWGITVSQDGMMLCVGSSNVWRFEETEGVQVYDVPNRKLLFTHHLGLRGGGGGMWFGHRYVECLDDTHGGQGGAIYLLYPPVSKPDVPLRHFASSPPRQLAAPRNDSRLFASLLDGRLYSMDKDCGHLKYLGWPVKQWTSGFAVSPDGNLLAVGYGRDYKRRTGIDELVLLDTRTGQVLSRFKHTYEVNGLAFSSDGKMLVATDRGNTLRVFQIRTR